MESQREPLSVVRSWVSQAAKRSSDVAELVFDRMLVKEGRSISQTDIWGLFGSAVRCVPDYTFMVDGLDECLRSDDSWKGGQSRRREGFLMKLRETVTHSHTRVLVVSRDESDIRSGLCANMTRFHGQVISELRITEDDTRSDVSLFSTHVVSRKLFKKDESFRRDLATKMADKSEGMFLWIKLQEQHLSGGKSQKQLRKIVDEMPQGLGHAYQRDWMEMSRLRNAERLRALAILRWAAFALRPLTLLELAEALVVVNDDTIRDLQLDDIPDAIDEEYVNEEIIALCGSLLEIRFYGPG